MGKYKVEIKRSAVKEIKKLPSADLKFVFARIETLSDDPRPPDCTKLSVEEKYRVRCGHYRILYTIEDQALIVVVVKAGQRKDVYKNK